MAEADARVPVEVLRHAARGYTGVVTLRTAADEIGLSFSGLRSFLRGTTPRPSTVQKLTVWYLGSAAARGEAEPRDLARVAISVLLQPIPERFRADAEARLIRAMVVSCAEAKVPLPSWLSESGPAQF